MRFESHDPAAEKSKWKIVRTDNYTDVEGEIVAAYEATGECTVKVAGEDKILLFGPRGIRIVKRGR